MNTSIVEKKLNEIIELVDQQFTSWSFVGSIVDWYYMKGNRAISDFDIVTDEPFIPKYTSPLWGPRTSFMCLGRSVDVFADTPSATNIPTIEEHLENLRWLQSNDLKRADKYTELILMYENWDKPATQVFKPTNHVCTHRGEQLRIITSTKCNKITNEVYSCGLYNKECVQRKLCDEHDPEILVCVGCQGYERNPPPTT